jgi:hypothetical protein
MLTDRDPMRPFRPPEVFSAPFSQVLVHPDGTTTSGEALLTLARAAAQIATFINQADNEIGLLP